MAEKIYHDNLNTESPLLDSTGTPSKEATNNAQSAPTFEWDQYLTPYNEIEKGEQANVEPTQKVETPTTPKESPLSPSVDTPKEETPKAEAEPMKFDIPTLEGYTEKPTAPTLTTAETSAVSTPLRKSYKNFYDEYMDVAKHNYALAQSQGSASSQIFGDMAKRLTPESMAQSFGEFSAMQSQAKRYADAMSTTATDFGIEKTLSEKMSGWKSDKKLYDADEILSQLEKTDGDGNKFYQFYGGEIYGDAARKIVKRYVDEHNHWVNMADKDYRERWSMANYGIPYEEFVDRRMEVKINPALQKLTDAANAYYSSDEYRIKQQFGFVGDVPLTAADDNLGAELAKVKGAADSFRDGSFVSGLKEGVFPALKNAMPLGVGVIMDSATMMEQVSALNKSYEGKPLSAREEFLVALWEANEIIEEETNLYRKGGSIAKTTSDAIQGIGTSAGIAMSGAQIIGKAVGKKILGEVAEQSLLKVLKNDGFKTAIKMTAKAAPKKLAVSATTSAVKAGVSSMTARNLAEDRLDQFKMTQLGLMKEEKNPLASLWKAYAMSFGEWFTEDLGDIADDIFSLGRRAALNKVFSGKLSKALTRLDDFKATSAVRNFLRDARIQGLTAEAGSELLNNYIQPLLTGEFFWDISQDGFMSAANKHYSDVLTWESTWDTITQSAIIAGTGMMSRGISSAMQGWQISSLRNQIRETLGDVQNEGLRNQLYELINSDTPNFTPLAGINWKSEGINVEDAQRAMQVVFKSAQVQEMRGEFEETQRLVAFAPQLQYILQRAYKGVDIAAPTETLEEIEIKKGDDILGYVLYGDVDSPNQVLQIVDGNGQVHNIATESLKAGGYEFKRKSIGDAISEQYALMFSNQISQERLGEVIETVRGYRGADAETKQRIIEANGFSVYKNGAAVTLVDGRMAVVKGNAENGQYTVDILGADGKVTDTAMVGFEYILNENDPKMAQAQMDAQARGALGSPIVLPTKEGGRISLDEINDSKTLADLLPSQVGGKAKAVAVIDAEIERLKAMQGSQSKKVGLDAVADNVQQAEVIANRIAVLEDTRKRLGGAPKAQPKTREDVAKENEAKQAKRDGMSTFEFSQDYRRRMGNTKTSRNALRRFADNVSARIAKNKGDIEKIDKAIAEYEASLEKAFDSATSEQEVEQIKTANAEVYQDIERLKAEKANAEEVIKKYVHRKAQYDQTLKDMQKEDLDLYNEGFVGSDKRLQKFAEKASEILGIPVVITGDVLPSSAYNGVHRVKEDGDAVIYINANSSRVEQGVGVMAHEILHELKSILSNEEWAKLESAILTARYGSNPQESEAYKDIIAQIIADEMAVTGRKIDDDKAREEVVAYAVQEYVFAGKDGANALGDLFGVDMPLTDKIMRVIRNVLRKFKALFDKQYIPDDAAKLQAVNAFANALHKAEEIRKEAYKANKIPVRSASGKESRSLATFNDWVDDRGVTHKGTRTMFIERMNANGFSDEQKADMIARMDTAYEYMVKLQEFTDEDGNLRFDAFNEWAKTTPHYKQIGRDYVKAITSLVSNGDYPINLELTTDCIKREAFTALVNELAKRGVDMGAMQPAQITVLQNMMQQYGIEVACRLCFVEGKRLGIVNWAETIVQDWNDALVEAGIETDEYFDFGKDGEIVVPTTPLREIERGHEQKVAWDAIFEVDLIMQGQDAKAFKAQMQKNLKAVEEYKKQRAEEWANKTKKPRNPADWKPTKDDQKHIKELMSQGVTVAQVGKNASEYREAFNRMRDAWIEKNPKKDPLSFNPTKKQWDALDKIRNREIATVKAKMVRLIMEHPEMRKKMQLKDLLGSKGLMEIRNQDGEAFADLWSIILQRFGTGTPKPIQDATPYDGEIMGLTKSQFDKANKIGGARLFSFSDFDITKIFDYMQMFFDLEANKQMLQSYTKEVPAVIALGRSNAKINISTLANADVPAEVKEQYEKANADGKKALKHKMSENAGLLLDEDGNIVGINFSKEHSVKPEFAQEIFHDDTRNKDCGAIMVGDSVNHAIYSAAQDWIRMVIPFHLSGIPLAARERTDTLWYFNNTPYQSTRKRSGEEGWTKLGTADKDFEFYNDMDKKGWNMRDKAREYIAWCEARGYRPKFDWGINSDYYRAFCEQEGFTPNQQIIDMMDADTTDGVWNQYYKFLTDFTAYKPVFNEKGEMIDEIPSPQLPVKATFDFSEMEREVLFEGEGSMLAHREGNIKRTQEHIGELADKATAFLLGEVTEEELGLRDDVHYENYADAEKYLEAKANSLQKQPDTQEVVSDADVVESYSISRNKKSVLETALPEDESSFKGTVVSTTDGAKILKDIDSAIESYENRTSRSKTFIGDVGTAFKLKDTGSSQYGTFETVNGRIVSLRVSDHNATVKNFDDHNEKYGISIVISRKDSEGITNNGTAHLVEYFYSDVKLQRADGKPLVEILKSLKQALYSGEYNDTTGLAVREEVNESFSISRNNEATIDKWLGKREDFTDEVKNAFKEFIADFKPATQLATTKWYANGVIRIPEDMPKVEQAMEIAQRKKVDALQYKSPMEIIDQFGDVFKPKAKLINPDDVPTLSNKVQVPNTDITIYDVEDSEESRKNFRELMNTHFGKNANPWCLMQAEDGVLTEDSKDYWDKYNKYPKRAAFNNGKLIAFFASADEPTWWSRMDKPYSGIPVTRKIEGDALGRSATYIVSEDGGFDTDNFTEIHKGNQHNGIYETWHNLDTKASTATYKDGKIDGVEEKYFKDGRIAFRINYKDGKRDGVYSIFNSDGGLLGEGIYKDGLKEGITQTWHKNGNLQWRGNYINGQLDGIVETWDENGNLEVREEYDNGSALIEEHYANGKLNGWVTRWDKDGDIVSREYYVDGKRNKLQEFGRKVADSFSLDRSQSADNLASLAESEGTTSFSLVRDEAKIAELEASPKRIGYRNVILNEDGSFSSPMAAYIGNTGKGKVKSATFNLGEWEEAEENPQLVDEQGKVYIYKDNGGSVKVAYDPYIHNRLDKVNAQFKEAWKRPNLVYVETEVPITDLESGYHADKAKLPVGVHSWSNGDLMLSRYDKPIRIVSWEEVADDWVARFKDRGVEFDIVPPALLPILKERGVEILPPHKGLGADATEAYEAFKAEQGASYSISVDKAEFDAVRDLAVENVGIVMPNLAEKNIKIVGYDGEERTPLDIDREDLKDWAKENVATKDSYIIDSNGVQHPCPITSTAIDKYIDGSSIEKSANEVVHKLALPLLPKILANSIEVEIHPDYNKVDEVRKPENGYNDRILMHRFYGAVEIDGVVYRAKSTIKEFKDKNTALKPYNYEITKIELLSPNSEYANNGTSKPSGIITDSISATKLLQNVEKSYDLGKKVLDESAKISEQDSFSLSRERADIERVAKENGTWLKAPNGKDTNLSPKQWVTVRTKAFKEWFGDWENDPENASKIVDENGEPKVVYHQTNGTVYINRETGENWDELDWQAKDAWDERDDWDEYWEEQDFYTFSRVNARTTNELDGFFFAPEYDEYHEYGKRTIPAFLNIRKPASSADYRVDSTYNNAGQKERIRMQNEGYDGVVNVESDGRVWEYIAFEPNQIKSATENIGTFDSANDDIRYSLNRDDVTIATPEMEAEANEELSKEAKLLAELDDAQNAYDRLVRKLKAVADRKELTFDEVRKFLLDESVMEGLQEASAGQYRRIIRNVLNVLEKTPNKRIKVESLASRIQEELLSARLNVANSALKAAGKDFKKLITKKREGRNTRGEAIAKYVDNETRNAVGLFVDIIEYAYKNSDGKVMWDNALLAGRAFGEGVVTIDKVLDDDEINGETLPAITRNLLFVYKYLRDRAVDVDTALNNQQSTASEIEQVETKIATLQKLVETFKAGGRGFGDALRELKAMGYRTIPVAENAIENLYAIRKQLRKEMRDYKSAEARAKSQLVQAIKYMNTAIVGVDKKGRVALKEELAKKKEKQGKFKAGIFRSVRSPHYKNVGYKEEYIDEMSYGKRRNIRRRGKVFWADVAETLEFLSRRIDRMSIPNEWLQDGWYYQFILHPTEGVLARADWRYKTEKALREQLNEKARELFAPDKKKGEFTIDDLKYNLKSKSGITVEILKTSVTGKPQHNAVKQTIELTLGQLLYMRAINAQEGGILGLITNGLTPSKVAQIVEYAEREYPQFCEFDDWIRGEDGILEQIYQIRNEIYRSINGVDLDHTEGYFPIQRKSDEVHKEEDVGNAINVATIAGGIGSNKKRVRNSVPIDITVDYFEKLDQHISESIQWCAAAELIEKVNALLSSKQFRQILEAQGFDKEAIKNSFKRAIGERLQTTEGEETGVDRVVTSISKNLVAANVAFNLNSALKQLVSLSASFSNEFNLKLLGYFARNLFLPSALMSDIKDMDLWNKDDSHFEKVVSLAKLRGCHRWAKENIPTYAERVDSANMGYDIFEQDGIDSWDRVSNWFKEWGMKANVYMDSVACAVLTKTYYDYQYERNKERGMSHQEAHDDARMRAANIMNQTQQSSQGAYMSKYQADKLIGAQAFVRAFFMAYQNSQLGFDRNARAAYQNLATMMYDMFGKEKGNSMKLMIKYQSEQYIARGIEKSKARKMAVADYRRSFFTQLNTLLHNMVLNNVLWTASSVLSANIARMMAAVGLMFKGSDYDDEPTEITFEAIWDEVKQELRKSWWLYAIPYSQTVLAKSFVDTVAGAMTADANSFKAQHTIGGQVINDLLGSIQKAITSFDYASDEEKKAQKTLVALGLIDAASRIGLGISTRTLIRMLGGVAGIAGDGEAEHYMNLFSSPRYLTKAVAGRPRKGETMKQYTERLGGAYKIINGNLKGEDVSKLRKQYIDRMDELMFYGTDFDYNAFKELEKWTKRKDARLPLKSDGTIREGVSTPTAEEAWRQMQMHAQKARANAFKNTLQSYNSWDEEGAKDRKKFYEKQLNALEAFKKISETSQEKLIPVVSEITYQQRRGDYLDNNINKWGYKKRSESEIERRSKKAAHKIASDREEYITDYNARLNEQNK